MTTSAREVRKTVTILFCDLVHSTGLAEGDPEAYRRVQTRFFDRMREIVERHGGTVEKFIGDEVMAVFGVPVVHEDDAVRAVRAAQEMQHALPELGLQARIGINTGEVLAGDPQESLGLVAGEPVIIAKRLEQGASAGEIIIGKATYPLVKHAVSAGPLERISMKGKQEGVGRRRVDDVDLRAPSLARRLDLPLVGRDEELSQLGQAFDSAVEEKSCRLYTVLGPPGIGKSRLAAELAEQLSERATAAVGRCLPYGEGITFWPLTEVARSLGDDELEGVLAADLPPEETFPAVRRAFEQAAEERPLLVCFEDLHWAEPTLLDLVEYVAGSSRGVPILILALARAELVEQRPSWIAPRANADALALEPLSTGEMKNLLGRLDAESALDPELRERISDAAEGNPLFAEQMAAMAAQNNGGELPIPGSLQGLLAERLDRLTREERDTVERAAVIGRDFPLSALLGLAADEQRPSLTGTLLSLVRKGLIRPERQAAADEDRFSFQHVLVRDAAYDAMPKELRAELHERLADNYADAAGDALIGYHLERAYYARAEIAPGDLSVHELAGRAARRLAAAGKRAEAREDIPAAVNLLERAAVLLADGSDDALRSELLLGIGSLMMSGGRFGEVAQVLDEASALSESGGSRRLWLRIQVERAFLDVFLDDETMAATLTEVANSILPELGELKDDLGLAKAWVLLSEPHVVSCRWATRGEMLDRALGHARRSGERRLVSNTSGQLCVALLFGPTPVEEAARRCEQLFEEAGLGALTTLAALNAMKGDFPTAREQWAEAARRYEELGLRFRRATRSLVGAQIELLAGDPQAAVEELRLGESELEAMGETGVRSTIAGYLANTLYAAGDQDGAYESSQRSESFAEPDDVGTQVLWRCARAMVLAERGDGAAGPLSEEAERLAAPTQFPDLQATTLLSRARVLGLMGREDDARPYVVRAVEIYERKGNIVAARQLAV
jgi:class 3 adenylate cyclase/tetratricopeptide (TPR) repeat protein